MSDVPTPVPVLFLAGIGRSGTTLVERTLAEVDGITALGEVMHLWERGLGRGELCSCGEPFLECPFWSRVGREAFGGWDQVDTARIAWLKARVDRALKVPQLAIGRPTSFAREVDEYVDHYVRVYRAAQQITGGLLIDSSKQPSLAWCLRRTPAIDLKILHCVRDSRGVTHSWARTVARPEAVREADAEMPRYSPPLMSAYWLLHNAEAEALGRLVPLRRLRYEDFVSDPAGEVDTILDFLGVSAPAPHVRGSSVHLGSGHSCAGNPMRFRTGELDVVADEGWRAQQPTVQRRLVTSLTAPLLLRYGYLR